LKYQEKKSNLGETIVKLTLKLMMVVCLFSSIALAEEGDMTGGGRTCPQGQTTCRPAEQLPDPTKDTKETNETDSILTIIQKYLISIFE
jgi:hypothetical protein